jgi:hypothetical protein
MTRAEQRQEWGKLISAYRASGMGAKKWCAANHVQFHQLKYRLYGTGSRRQRSRSGGYL